MLTAADVIDIVRLQYERQRDDDPRIDVVEKDGEEGWRVTGDCARRALHVLLDAGGQVAGFRIVP